MLVAVVGIALPSRILLAHQDTRRHRLRDTPLVMFISRSCCVESLPLLGLPTRPWATKRLWLLHHAAIIVRPPLAGHLGVSTPITIGTALGSTLPPDLDHKARICRSATRVVVVAGSGCGLGCQLRRNPRPDPCLHAAALDGDLGRASKGGIDSPIQGWKG